MKKNLTKLVLILEIALITLLHAIKIKESDKSNPAPETARTAHFRPDVSSIFPYILAQLK
jgi:hypothetical protein